MDNITTESYQDPAILTNANAELKPFETLKLTLGDDGEGMRG